MILKKGKKKEKLLPNLFEKHKWKKKPYMICNPTCGDIIRCCKHVCSTFIV